MDVGGQSGPFQLHGLLPLRGSAYFGATGEKDGVSSNNVPNTLVLPMTNGVLAARTFPQLGSFPPSFAESVIQPMRECSEFV